MDVNKPHYPMPPYHFMTFTEYEDLPNPGVKLGVMLEKTAEGLLIKRIIPGSVAEKNEFHEQDLLTHIDSQELQEPFDLIYELQQKGIGDKVELTLKRGNNTLLKKVEFTEPSKNKHGMR
jgi:S1-C subfamily serine protease